MPTQRLNFNFRDRMIPRRDICDTGDDALPDPNAPKQIEKEPETLEEALAVAAKRLRGVDTDHRKLTIQELQRALFDEDLNPFVTWLTANASTVFSAFDVDGDRTLDYDELVYCISMRARGVPSSRCGPKRFIEGPETTHVVVRWTRVV